MELETSLHAPETWERKTIDSVCTWFTSGGTPSRRRSEFYNGGTIPWVKTQELADWLLYDAEEKITPEAVENSSAKVLPEKTVLMAMYGATVGQLAILGREMACNQASAAMVVDPAIVDYRFLFYQLLANRQQVKSLSTGAAQQNLSGRQIREFVLAFPSLREQRAIVDVLWLLDSRRALLSNINRTLESIAQAVFKSWFIDFDPVHAKVGGQEPIGMETETAALFPSGFEDSGLEPIPVGWHLGTMKDITKNVRIPIDPEQTDPETPYIGLQHMPLGSIALDAWGVAGGLQSGKLAFQRNDVLFGRLRPYFHKVGIAPLDGVSSTDILVLRPAKDEFHGIVTMYASSDDLIDYATRMSTGARMPRVSWKDIAAYKIVVPPSDVAAAYQRATQPLFEQILANVAKTQTLADLRNTLLPRLISGRLRIPEAEEIVQEAVS